MTLQVSVEVRCLDCGHTMPYESGLDRCPRCGGEWLQAVYDYDAVRRVWTEHLSRRPFDLWRYHELLPVQAVPPPMHMGEGGTPLFPAPHLSMMLKQPNIYIKDERQNPTSSFKDRQAAVTIAVLKEAGLTEVVVASTGNVAIAYSAYASRAGIKLWAFVSSSVPLEKMREIAIYGTQVIKVTGTYDQTKQVAARFARERGLYLDRGARSIPTVESMKTLAFEIAEQLATRQPASRYGAPQWAAPDWYVQAVSGGLGPLGVAKGFRELYEMGLIDKMPKLAIVQAAGCDPMVRAWEQDSPRPVDVALPHTHITTLGTGRPGRTYTLLYEYVKQHGGAFVRVTDEEAFRAMHMMAKMEGLSMEPAAAVAFAGLTQLVREGVIQPHETVVVNCTGHTMPIESHLLGERWAQEVTAEEALSYPSEGLLTALAEISPRHHTKVLIVDDHEPARVLFRRILQSLGDYHLLEAADGPTALRLAREEKPNLIILDLMMPGMDGFQVLEALKSEPETADIPVIVVTAKHLSEGERERIEALARSLLFKGEFLSDEFFEEIRSLLEQENS